MSSSWGRGERERSASPHNKRIKQLTAVTENGSHRTREYTINFPLLQSAVKTVVMACATLAILIPCCTHIHLHTYLTRSHSTPACSSSLHRRARCPSYTPRLPRVYRGVRRKEAPFDPLSAYRFGALGENNTR